MESPPIEVSTGPEGVCVITFRAGENLFNPDFLAAFHRALDEVEAAAEATGLVTGGEGRHYCGGFDLGYFQAVSAEEVLGFVERTCELLGRVLTFPVPTVAAVNGHAFGVGMVLALAHDQQVMNSERGWLCLPEIELGLQFHPLLQELVVAKLGRSQAADAILSADRFGGLAAAELGLVDEAVPPVEVVDAARRRIEGRIGRGREITARLKRDLYVDVLDQLGRAPWSDAGAGATS